MADKLKACPFCGGEPNLTHSDYVHDDLRPMPVVECKSCSAWVRAEDWNRRAKAHSQGDEAVEVVAYRASLPDEPDLGHWFSEAAENEPQYCQYEPLMTVSQHQRILAAATQPADQVTSAELLGRLAHYLECSSNLTSADYGGEGYDLARELRALLEKP